MTSKNEGWRERLLKTISVPWYQVDGQDRIDIRAAIEAYDRLKAERDAIKHAACEVMTALAHHGAAIVPHLMDTDDNAGERLRRLCGLA